MFTNNNAVQVENNKVLIEASCLSSDSKPTRGIANGSTCLEMDTSKIYFFDEKNSTWREWV